MTKKQKVQRRPPTHPMDMPKLNQEAVMAKRRKHDSDEEEEVMTEENAAEPKTEEERLAQAEAAKEKTEAEAAEEKTAAEDQAEQTIGLTPEQIEEVVVRAGKLEHDYLDRNRTKLSSAGHEVVKNLALGAALKGNIPR